MTSDSERLAEHIWKISNLPGSGRWISKQIDLGDTRPYVDLVHAYREWYQRQCEGIEKSVWAESVPNGVWYPSDIADAPPVTDSVVSVLTSIRFSEN